MLRINLAHHEHVYPARLVAALQAAGTLDGPWLMLPEADYRRILADTAADPAHGDPAAWLHAPDRAARRAIQPAEARAFRDQVHQQHCLTCPHAGSVLDSGDRALLRCPACRTCGGAQRINPAFQGCPEQRFVSLFVQRRYRPPG